MLEIWHRMTTTMKLVSVVYAITFIHHIYGGIIYSSTERIVIAIVFSLVYVATLWLYHQYSKVWGRWAFWAMVIIFWIGLVGIGEGGYNHALYLLVWFTDNTSLMASLYPAGGDVKIPDNVFFETTGVLTLFSAVVLGVAAVVTDKSFTRG